MTAEPSYRITDYHGKIGLGEFLMPKEMPGMTGPWVLMVPDTRLQAIADAIDKYSDVTDEGLLVVSVRRLRIALGLENEDD